MINIFARVSAKNTPIWTGIEGRNFFLNHICSIYASVEEVQNKKSAFFGNLDFPKFFEGPICDCRNQISFNNGFFNDAVVNEPFVLRLQMGLSLPLFALGVGKVSLMEYQSWSSRSQRGLLGWKFQSFSS